MKWYGPANFNFILGPGFIYAFKTSSPFLKLIFFTPFYDYGFR